MYDSVAADLDQEVVDNNPLILPTHHLLNLAKRRRGILIHKLVMKLQHCSMQLRNDHVFVVTLITDQGSLRRLWIVDIDVTRKITHIGSLAVLSQGSTQPEFVAVKHVRLISRTPSIHGIKIKTRSAEIHEGVRIV